jgi:hypothetical protein
MLVLTSGGTGGESTTVLEMGSDGRSGNSIGFFFP